MKMGQARGAELSIRLLTVALVKRGMSTGVKSILSHLSRRYSRPILAESNMWVVL